MKNISESVAVNDFVRRQTKDSGKTYAENLTFEDIKEMHDNDKPKWQEYYNDWAQEQFQAY